jgi:hypothetical protein
MDKCCQGQPQPTMTKDTIGRVESSLPKDREKQVMETEIAE